MVGVLLLSSTAVHALPSFPGAEGFGAVATGGRGGQVIKVTNLNASGPGSLQAALDVDAPRIIVFSVSGVIDGEVTVTHGDVTIAGQTAPGAGITIAGRLMGEYDADVRNIIIRHVRVRPPPRPSGIDGNQYDAMQFSLNREVMLDHLSVSWGVDENVDLYEAQDCTVQWSIIAEAEVGAGHPDGAEHNYGLINGPDGHRIAVHHVLFAHNKNRNPAIANGPAELRNNVAYNVRHGFIHHNPASGHFNIVGNTYRRGPDDTLVPFFFDDENDPEVPGLRYYLADNAVDDPGEYVGVVQNPWVEPFLHESFEYLNKPEANRSAVEFDFSAMTGFIPVTTQGPSEAYALVLAQSGAFPRDAVDTRVLAEVLARNGAWDAHRPASLLAGLTAGTGPADVDNDGMADDWEAANGLSAADGNDHSTVRPSGYTAIEEYVNGLADGLSPTPVTPDGGVPGPSSSASGPVAASSSGTTAPTSAAGATSALTASSAANATSQAGTATSAPGGSGGVSSSAGAGTSEPNGCGCRSVGMTPGGIAALLIGMVLLRRRSAR